MSKMLRPFTGLVFGVSLLTAQAALAQTAIERDMAMQDMASMTVGETVISLGGGFAYLTLPDTRFTFRYSDSSGNTVSKQKNDAFDEYGSGLSGSIATPLGGAFGMPWVGAVHGYWSSIEDTNRNRCVSTNSQICGAADIIDQPGSSTVSASTLVSHTDRDVDSWGAAFELTTPNPRPMLLPGIMKSTRWGAAFDVRGLDQDLRINGQTGGVSNLFKYRETLDTTYYGGYLTFGGEYSLFPALYGGWGLRSFIDLHAGIYGADADYNGNFTGKGIGGSRLGLTDDEVAFIGGVKFETRKQFGARTSLSLLSEYDWYSWVPAMRYNDGDGRSKGIVDQTHITDGDAFSQRTSLRLNIGLGPSGLYAPQ